MGTWTDKDGELPWTVFASTPRTHHSFSKSLNVSLCFLLRNHLCPSPDFLGRSSVAQRKSARMARSRVAAVAATTAGLVTGRLVSLRRCRSFQSVCRKVTRKRNQSKHKAGDGLQSEGSPTMRIAGLGGGGWPLIFCHKSQSHFTAGWTMGHSQNACKCVSSGPVLVVWVPTKNPTVPSCMTWAPGPAHDAAAHKQSAKPAALPELSMPGSLYDPILRP